MLSKGKKVGGSACVRTANTFTCLRIEGVKESSGVRKIVGLESGLREELRKTSWNSMESYKDQAKSLNFIWKEKSGNWNRWHLLLSLLYTPFMNLYILPSMSLYIILAKMKQCILWCFFSQLLSCTAVLCMLKANVYKCLSCWVWHALKEINHLHKSWLSRMVEQITNIQLLVCWTGIQQLYTASPFTNLNSFVYLSNTNNWTSIFFQALCSCQGCIIK